MSPTDRNTSRDAVSAKKQAMKAIQRIPASQIALIAASPAALQLSLFSQQEKAPATVALPDSVRGKAGAQQNTGLKKEKK